MSEFKGTPGPYEHSTILSASENHKGFNIWKPIDGGRHGSFIAEVSPRDEDGIEGEANAHLLAASWDMLEALLSLRNAIAGSSGIEDTMKLLTAWATDTMQPAIAKALGETP